MIEAANNTSPTFTEAGAAAYLSLSKSTLRSWRSQRKGPSYVRLGRRVGYQKASLDRFLAANEVDTQEVTG